MRRQNPQYKRNNSAKPFPIEPVLGMFDRCDKVTKESDVSQQLLTSQERLQTSFIDHTFVGHKRPISSPENVRTNNSAAILEGFGTNPPSIVIS